MNDKLFKTFTPEELKEYNHERYEKEKEKKIKLSERILSKT